MKCSMFDISDPSDVKETDRFVLKDVSFCDALTNYRSILLRRRKACLVLPTVCMEAIRISMIQVKTSITVYSPLMKKTVFFLSEELLLELCSDFSLFFNG